MGRLLARVHAPQGARVESIGQSRQQLLFWTDILSRGPVLLHLIRRYGCGICRDMCKELMSLKPALDLLGVRPGESDERSTRVTGESSPEEVADDR